ncbi:MAG: transcription elongation factor GreA [Spirochaetaceae bacterium]|jgi:transcription elongation factor GreA|nr:transcription elongation factor GreA [Spirochaetaceae bacterium]
MAELTAKAEDLVKNVQAMLNEEKWTRATLSAYSSTQFKELDEILDEARAEKASDEIKNIADEHLAHTKNSIVALYLSGMIAISRQLVDDSALINLIGIFTDNHKWSLVRFLCDRMLDYGESKFALRTLIDVLRNENDEDSIWAIEERLVKADYEEADIAKALAEHKETEGKLEEAIDYYKKATHRYLNKNVFTNVREIWAKLLELDGDDIDFFMHIQAKAAKNIDKTKAIQLLQDLYEHCKAQGHYETAVNVLKMILDYDDKDAHARRDIADCYREIYKKHSQLEEYLRSSNLATNYRNVHECIADFEKHIAFDRGNFVYHRTWGVGRIKEIVGDDIIIDFARQRGHKMSLKMAVSSLQTLSKNHIWVLKATQKKEILHDKVKSDPVWALKTVIKSFGNSCDIKKIKSELCPSVLTVGEWTSWFEKAKNAIKTDPQLGVNPDNVELLTVRDRPVSYEEKLYNEFKAEKDFFKRLATMREFCNRKDFEPDSDYFTEMFDYFASFLKNAATNKVSEQILSAYFMVKDLAGRYPALQPALTVNFPQLLDSIKNIPAMYLALKESKLKEDFLASIKLFTPSWQDIYIQLYPKSLSQTIINNLLKDGSDKSLANLVKDCFDRYRDRGEAVAHLYKNYRNEPWFKAAGLTEEKQLITLIHILAQTFNNIDNHKETSENKKLNKNVDDMLFKEGFIYRIIDHAEIDEVNRVYTFINDVRDIDPAIKLEMRTRILRRFPDFKFYGAEEESHVATRGLLVTAKKYDEKQKQMAHIMNVEVPANSKEIEFARELGDLRENAEYKAAKEKQELLNSQVAKLKDEIERAQLFDPSTISTVRVGFGTIVRLKNSASGKEETYTILGPWESDPDNKVISYLSPFGAAMQGKKLGEAFELVMGEDKTGYEVVGIEAAGGKYF